MSHLHQSVMNRTILENVSVMIDRVPEEEEDEDQQPQVATFEPK